MTLPRLFKPCQQVHGTDLHRLLTDWFRSDLGAQVLQTEKAMLDRLLPYVSAHLAQGGRLNSVTRHILGLYHGQPRARQFRRHLSEHGVGEGPGLDVLVAAIAIAEGRAPTIDAGTSSSRAVAAE